MVCSENFDEYHEKRSFPTVAIVSLMNIGIIVAFGIPTYLAMRKEEDADAAAGAQANGTPKSLESLGTNIAVVFGIMLQPILQFLFKLDSNPTAFMMAALEVMFFAPGWTLFLMVISVFRKRKPTKVQIQQSEVVQEVQ